MPVKPKQLTFDAARQQSRDGFDNRTRQFLAVVWMDQSFTVYQVGVGSRVLDGRQIERILDEETARLIYPDADFETRLYSRFV